MSTNINLSTCDSKFAKLYCITDSTTVIWDNEVKESCAYIARRSVIAQRSNNTVISNADEFAVHLSKLESQCNIDLWSTDEGLYLHINKNISNKVQLPTRHEDNFSKSSGINTHTTIKLAMLSYIVNEMEDMIYDLFVSNYLAICRLQVQYLQMLKRMTYKGDAVGVIKMILNSTTITAAEHGDLISIT